MLPAGLRHVRRLVVVAHSAASPAAKNASLAAIPRRPFHRAAPTAAAASLPTPTTPPNNEMEPPAPAGVLPSTRDRFRGITVDTDLTAIDVGQFAEQLKLSLDWWQQRGCRAIWFRINLASTALVPQLAAAGFDFHHARDGFVMMVRWVDASGQPANIPPYAHHMVGVGGLVINARDQVLAISEQQAAVPGSWKLPGGYVEPAENLVEAAVREVEEETGIRTRFETMISVRHSHNANFDCSDLYVVMALRTLDDGGRATDGKEDEIRMCPREIAAAKWMEFDEYLQHPRVHELNRNVLRQYLQMRETGVRIERVEGVHPFLRRTYNVYGVDLKGAKL